GSVAATDGGGLALATRGGLRVPLAPGSARAGETLTLLVRPEKIALAGEGQALVEGEVVEAIYLGESTRYVVRSAGGEVFVVKQQNLVAGAALKAGKRAGGRWGAGGEGRVAWRVGPRGDGCRRGNSPPRPAQPRCCAAVAGR